jgi:hypothetical protein
VQAVVADVDRLLLELGGLHLSGGDVMQRPLAIGFDGQAKDLVKVMSGGKWVWLHGTGMCWWPGQRWHLVNL